MKKIKLFLFSILVLFLGNFKVLAFNPMILDNIPKFRCGGFKIPKVFPQITSKFVLILQIAIPVIVVLLGMVDLVKSVISNKEDEIKKGRQQFIKRLIVGVSVFLVFAIVRTIIGLVEPNNTSMWNCVDCFINGCSRIN